MKAKYNLGGHGFSSKKKISDHAMRMLNNHIKSRKDIQDSNEFRFLDALFKMHPNYEVKTKGKDVVMFFVEYPGDLDFSYGKRSKQCFWFQLEDGEQGWFSFRKCLQNPETANKQDVRNVFRKEIEYQVMSFKDDVFESADGKPNCEVTKIRLKRDNCHVDHYPVKFATLVTDFLSDKGLTLEDIKVNSNSIKDKELADEWRDYHSKEAGLRLVLDKVNLQWDRLVKEGLYE